MFKFYYYYFKGHTTIKITDCNHNTNRHKEHFERSVIDEVVLNKFKNQTIIVLSVRR